MERLRHLAGFYLQVRLQFSWMQEDLHSRNVLWRYPEVSSVDYPSCSLSKLNEGLLVLAQGVSVKLQDSVKAYYRGHCYNEEPVCTSNNQVFMKYGAQILPISSYSWNLYLDVQSGSNTFKSSGYPIIYTVSTATVIVCFIAVTMFTKQYLRSQRPSYLLKLSTLLSAGQMLVMYIHSMVQLKKQNRKGRFSANRLVQSLLSSNAINGLYLVDLALLQISQAQIITRLFPRRKEKRVIFAVGVCLSVISQILWGLSTFLSSSSDIYSSGESVVDYDDIAILPAFTYLLRISQSVMYSCLVIVYCASRRRLIFKKELVLLTLCLLLSINLSIAFFIADVSNMWVSELSEVFDLTCYVIANFLTWEWINRVNQFERMRHKEGVLGRPFYEEDEAMDGENGHISQYTFQEQQSSSSDPYQGATDILSPNSKNKSIERKAASIGVFNTVFNAKNSVTSALETTVTKILSYTDKMLLRSSSALSNRFVGISDDSGGEQSRVNRHGTDVFVYAPKAVAISSQEGSSTASHAPENQAASVQSQDDEITASDDSIWRHVARVNGEEFDYEEEVYDLDSSIDSQRVPN